MYPLRSTSLALLTIGQILAEYRFHKNPVQLRGKEAGLSDRYILVSGHNANIPEERRRLPSHIEFFDGTVIVLLKDGNQRVIDSKKHTSDHAKQYADMFLYLPWDDEEDFLGESSRSMEACQAMWDVHKDMALDLKEQLRCMTRKARLS